MTHPTPSHPSPTRPAAREARSRRTTALVQELAACACGERQPVEERLVLCNLPVAHALARRFRDRGVHLDDLEQVARLALVRATRRFDPGAGSDFLSFCVPSIRGELRKYFRDQGWVVRPPRRVQDLQRAIGGAQQELGRLGATPTSSDLARHLDVALDDVVEAMALRGAYTPASLDRPVGPDATVSLGDLLSAVDRSEQQADARLVLVPLVRRLKQRDQRIVALRFFHEWTQQEIADDIGVTQMQVSRLLTRIYADLRVMLGDPDASAMVA